MYKIYYLTSIIDNNKPRYIGYTSLSLEKRLMYHVSDSKRGKKTHKSNWIKSLFEKGSKPIIIQLDIAKSEEEACYLEVSYIKSLSKDNKLTNSTSGGEKSKVFIDSVKEKISNSLKEYYKNNKNWNQGLKYNFSKERNEKRREKMGDKISGKNNHFYGKKHKLETIKILSEKNKKYNYNYSMIYDYYIIKNLNRKEISKETSLPEGLIGKLIYKYKLTEVKKKVYGKIKGKKTQIDNKEILYKYYDYSKI